MSAVPSTAGGPGGPLSATGLLRRTLRRVPHAAVARGLPSRWLGNRWIATRELVDVVADPGAWTELAPARAEHHPLPVGVGDASELPDDAGWWGYSLADVPTRTSGPTGLVALDDVRLLPHRDAGGLFHPALLDARGRSVELPQTSYRPFHRPLIRGSGATRLDEAVWIAERACDNHSHWLTAHLPKLVLLRELGRLDALVLPDVRTGPMRRTLALLGIDVDAVPTVASNRPADVGRLTTLVTDRFDPRLLARARDAIAAGMGGLGGLPGTTSSEDGVAGDGTRLWISRARSAGRRLLEEEMLLPRLRDANVERVFLEELDFDAQWRLMRSAGTVIAPHGAGLTNILFCGPGTRVVELADPLYPNPNFYAMAAGLDHPYRRVDARAVGEGHRLTRDLSVAPAAIDALLDELFGGGPATVSDPARDIRPGTRP